MSHLAHWMSVLGAASSLICNCVSAQVPGYHLVQHIVTDSGELGFLTIDPHTRQLFGAGNAVVSLDHAAIRPFQLPEHGILVASDLGIGIGMDGTVFDLQSLRAITQLRLNGFTSAYDGATGRALLFRRIAIVVGVRERRVLDSVDIGGEPLAAIGDGHGRVFVNRFDADSLIVIDARGSRVMARWGLGPCHEPNGLAIDQSHRRLFVACSTMLVVLDSDDGHVVATVPGIRGGNQIAFDPGSGFIFNANGRKGGASMSVIREVAADTYAVIETVPTGVDAGRALAVDTLTHRVYIACGHFTPLISVYVFAPSVL